mgnify:CR=1 FL=1|tara:strand:+ start:654 stop:1475 length:822 start_codon:yes stop_codon:yes gene_type:complete
MPTPAIPNLSNSVAFDLATDDLIEEAFERCGAQARAGYDLKSIRRSINLLLAEWGNRGIHFWKVENINVKLVEGQDYYDFFWDNYRRNGATSKVATSDGATDYLYNVDQVLQVSYRSELTSPTDTAMTSIDRSTYAAVANKLGKGTPSQFYVQRLRDRTRVWVYQTASSGATNYLNIWKLERIQTLNMRQEGDTLQTPVSSAGSPYQYDNDVPYRFLPALCSGLAYYLSMKIAPQKTQELKLFYEDELARALAEDGSAVSAYITPKAYYPAIT